MLYLPAPHASLEEREGEGRCGAEEGSVEQEGERGAHTCLCACLSGLCAHKYWPQYEACVSICTFVLVKHQESHLRLYQPPASPCTLSDVTHTLIHTHIHTHRYAYVARMRIDSFFLLRWPCGLACLRRHLPPPAVAGLTLSSSSCLCESMSRASVVCTCRRCRRCRRFIGCLSPCLSLSLSLPVSSDKLPALLLLPLGELVEGMCRYSSCRCCRYCISSLPLSLLPTCLRLAVSLPHSPLSLSLCLQAGCLSCKRVCLSL